MFILCPCLYIGCIIKYIKWSGKIPNDVDLIAYVG